MDLAIRLEHEAYYHEHAWFVTLTYNDENLPHGGTLVADHISTFVKNLRYRCDEKIRYFGIGEYGGTFGRAHYHIILFGPELADKQYHYSKPDSRFYSPEFVQMFGNPSALVWYRSDTLEKAWKKGHADMTAVSSATMQYVSKYHIEKVTGDNAEDYYTTTDELGNLVELEPEQARMSRNPGIGKKWIEEFWQDIYPKGHMNYAGGKCAPPKYYDRWLEENHPDVYQEVKQQREDSIRMELYLDKVREDIDANRRAQMACPVALKLK